MILFLFPSVSVIIGTQEIGRDSIRIHPFNRGSEWWYVCMGRYNDWPRKFTIWRGYICFTNDVSTTVSVQTANITFSNNDLPPQCRDRDRWSLLGGIGELGTNTNHRTLLDNSLFVVASSERRPPVGTRNCTPTRHETKRIWKDGEEVYQRICEMKKKPS